MDEYNFLKMMIIGTLTIIAVVLVLSVAVFIVLSLLPYAIGYAIALAASWLWDAIHRRPSPPRKKPVYRTLQANPEWHRKEVGWKKQPEAKQEAEAEPGESDVKEELGELPKSIPQPLNKHFYLERKLSKGQREELERRGYKRLKTSAFGDAGASYYLVNKRWNEGSLHAFFCFLIEDELRKMGKEPELFVNDGPDIVFEHEGQSYCIDVETGTNLARSKEKVERKFERYRQMYYRSFILVTKKKLKHRYRKYGIVLTRASLLKALNGTLK